MRIWPGVTLVRRRPIVAGEDGQRASVQGSSAVSVGVTDAESQTHDRVERELIAASSMVKRGIATRVLVCNAPATIDFDEVRLLADTLDVRIEPIVRVGGGAFDFVVFAAVLDDG